MDIIGEILKREGGWSDRPEDKGGPTNKGVTLSTLTAWLGHEATLEDLRALSEADARSIYEDLFVVKPGFLAVKDGQIKSLVVDCAVNHGPFNAIKLLQHALGVKDDGVLGPLTRQALAQADYAKLYRRLCAERIRFYGRIITNNPSQAVFAAGWLNRAAEFVEQA